MARQSDEINVNKLAGIILSSEPKTEIVKSLIKSDKRFSDLQKETGMTSGRLNYHLLKLHSVGLLSRIGNKRYTLTPIGREITRRYLWKADRAQITQIGQAIKDLKK